MKKILLTGATGFIGNELGKKLFEAGYHLKVVSRSQKMAQEKLLFPAEIIECDLNRMALPESDFQDVFCLIHLAGESIDGRWSKEKKKNILESRENSSINILKNRPSCVESIFSVSAQGIYGDQGNELLNEDAKLGADFLADVCKKWEKPFQDLMMMTTKQVTVFRLGLVLSKNGGALKKMLPIFSKNLGASLGSGNQWMSWIHLDDVCQAFLQGLNNKNYAGVINLTSDHPVTNNEWTKTLCRTLKVVQLPTIPRFLLKALFGEMSSLLLNSIKVNPKKLKELQFNYLYPDLKLALEKELLEETVI